MPPLHCLTRHFRWQISANLTLSEIITTLHISGDAIFSQSDSLTLHTAMCASSTWHLLETLQFIFLNFENKELFRMTSHWHLLTGIKSKQTTARDKSSTEWAIFTLSLQLQVKKLSVVL